MAVFRQHSAQVRVVHDVRGLATVTYSGPTSPETFSGLRKLVVPAIAGSGALLVDVRGMLLLDTVVSAIDAGTFIGDESPPAAIIAPLEVVDLWKGYADDAAMRGIIRAVFIDPQLALDWALLWLGLAQEYQQHPASGLGTLRETPHS